MRLILGRLAFTARLTRPLFLALALLAFASVLHPQPTWAQGQPDPRTGYDPRTVYVPRELLVAGDPVELDRALILVQQRYNVRLVEDQRFGALGPYDEAVSRVRLRQCPRIPGQPAPQRVREFRKYLILAAPYGPGDESINAYFAFRLAARQIPGITVTPNLRTFARGQWDIGDSPVAAPALPVAGSDAEALHLFGSQWAFSAARGINLPPQGNRTGDGVVIGVFDTAPLSRSVVGHPALAEIVAKFKIPAVPLPVSVGGVDDVSNHGLFVAGMAKHVAPKSEIHPWRVLNDQGHGDLATLLSALISFHAQMNSLEYEAHRSVINLSLGLRQTDLPRGYDDQDVALFKQTVYDLTVCGHVFVAAAGNDGKAEKEAQIPARYWGQSGPGALPMHVIGVAGSNPSRNHSDFSQPGLVGAPGGETTVDGGVIEIDADRSIVGPYSAFGNGFAYWAGTSFATPQVAGLAARILQEPHGCGALPSQYAKCVAQKLCKGASGAACPASLSAFKPLGAGIVNVLNTAP